MTVEAVEHSLKRKKSKNIDMAPAVEPTAETVEDDAREKKRRKKEEKRKRKNSKAPRRKGMNIL